jgi:DeoR family transcriptional regulator, aga operon transcriptional repressor
VILTGGTLRKNSFSLVGPIAEETLRRLNADILFLGGTVLMSTTG